MGDRGWDPEKRATGPDKPGKPGSTGREVPVPAPQAEKSPVGQNRGMPVSAAKPMRPIRPVTGAPMGAKTPRPIRQVTGKSRTGGEHQSNASLICDLKKAANITQADGLPPFSARFLQADTDALRPAKVSFFFHKIFVWIRGTLTDAESLRLHANSQGAEIRKHGDWYYSNGKPIYQLNNPGFTFRIELKVPTAAAWTDLAQRDDTSVTLAEFAVDCSYCDDAERLKTHRAFDVGFVQPWQRSNDRRSWVGNDGTSTGRRRGMYHTWYSDRASPAAGDHDPETGEVWACFHMEARVNTGTKLKHLGIANAADAANFDHEAFWGERFKLWVVDFERLGRHHLNKAAGKKRRGPHPKGGYNGKSYDWHTGRVLWRAHAYDDSGMLSVQTFLKNYGRGPFLKAVSVEHLLGANNGSMSIAK